ncbi:MAG: ankyrin repeat domain-containing protein [Bacteroidota bacterium]
MLRFKSVLPVAAFVWLSIILPGCSRSVVNMDGDEHSSRHREADSSAPNNNEVGAEHAVTLPDHGSTGANQQDSVARGDAPSMEMDDALSSDRRESSSLAGLGEEAAAAQGALEGPEDQDLTLHTVARDGNVNLIRHFLDLGEDINARDSQGDTPLHIAVRYRQEAAIRLLLAQGANVATRVYSTERTPLHIAAENGHEDVIEVLLDPRWNPRADINARDSAGRTPLHVAVTRSHHNVICLLLGRGGSLEAQDNDGWRPLHYATFSGNDSTVRLLLARQAEVDIRENNGATPLHIAASYGRDEIIQLLLDHEAPINTPDEHGRTPLDSAASHGKLKATALLLERGAVFNTNDEALRQEIESLVAAGNHEEAAGLLIESYQ